MRPTKLNRARSAKLLKKLAAKPPSACICSVNIYSGYADFRGPSSTKRQAGNAGGDRRTITEFSSGARRNFLKRMFSLSVLPDLAVTLTYPGIYAAEAETWKRHLDNFSHEFRRRFPGSWFFWKLEPQRRGAPHFHLIGSVGGGRLNIFFLRQFIAETWFRIVGSGDERHLNAGTQADYINDSFGKVRAYVCKYVGKRSGSDLPQWATPGRFWGIIGRKNLPTATCCQVLLPRDAFFKLRRLVRKWMKRFATSTSYSKRLKNLSAFFVLVQHGIVFRLLEGALGFSLPQASNSLAPAVLDFELIPF